MAGILRSQSMPPPPHLTLHSPKCFIPTLLFLFLPHAFGSCFSPSLHLVKNLTLCGENMGFVLDEEMGEESHLHDAGAGVL